MQTKQLNPHKRMIAGLIIASCLLYTIIVWCMMAAPAIYILYTAFNK